MIAWRRAKRFARRKIAPPLHVVASCFKVDGEEAFDDPVGLNGAVLSAELLGVSAKQSALDNLTLLFERGRSLC